MRKPISLKEIARLAEVSHPTVSRALQNSPLISQKTRDRIRRIAEEHGYRPNRNARSLVTQRSNFIGCVVTDIADPFISEVISGVEQVAAQHQYSLILTNSGGDPGRESRAVHSLVERSIDGVLIIAATTGGATSPDLSQRKIPIVLVNNHHPGNYVHSIGVANYDAARSMTQHLLQLGHRRIGYIGNMFGGQADRDRHRGYQAALSEAQVRVSPRHVFHTDSSLEGGHRGMAALLKSATRPTAVFCYDDMTALGGYKAIRDAGLKMPDDISVTGFDDLFFASYLEPALTTIRQPMRAMGEQAMKLLLELLGTQANTSKPRKMEVEIPGELIVRNSTKARSAVTQ